MERAFSFTKGRTQVPYGSIIGYYGVYHHSKILDETRFEHGRHCSYLSTFMAIQKWFQVENLGNHIVLFIFDSKADIDNILANAMIKILWFYNDTKRILKWKTYPLT